MQRTGRFGLYAVICFLTITSVAGCGELLDPGGGTGTLKVLITDAPFPIGLIESATITITRVEVRCAGDDDEEEIEVETEDGDTEPNAQTAPTTIEDEPEGADADTCPWIVVYDADDDEEDDGRTFELLDLQNGRTDLLADVEIPAGTYTQMRLITPGGTITLLPADNGGEEVNADAAQSVEDDEDPPSGPTFELTVPSGEQTGIKLHFTFEVVADEETVLLLDVQLDKLFKPIPGGKIDSPDDIREFKFQPSIALKLINLLEAGSIAGRVTDDDPDDPMPLGHVQVTEFDANGDEVGTTYTEQGTEEDPGAAGTYVLVGLLAGTYSVEFSADGFVTQTETGVAVMLGEETMLDAALVASPPPSP